jgi:NADPH-dependent stearoyl-CoA 9-desaturase
LTENTTMNTHPQLTRAQIDSLQTELDAIRDEVLADLGERDARHIRRMVRIARWNAITGRSLLAVGFDPVTFVLGVAALSTAKILENMEIGHNVLHGQYDWMNDPALSSQTYEWDNVCDSAQWRHSHNYSHHTYTNILGKDKDVGYGILRVADEQYWKPKHLLQPVNNVLLSSMFQWGVGVHDIEWGKALKGQMDRAEVKQQFRPFLLKIRRQLFKDYVLFPLLCFWNAPRVLLGNLIANGIRNVWSNVIIFCGHFPEGTRVYTQEETRNETRGDWYLRQMQGSANIEGGRLLHIFSGHLSHQIEHHLFPDMPAHRYAEIAPRVRAVCEKYGIPYNTGSFWRQYGSVLRGLFKRALPTRRRALVAA